MTPTAMNERLDGKKWVGRILRDRWRIDARLARGGVGTVYAATHRNGSRAAIKVLHPEFARVEDTRRRFLQEGYAANQVNHPGVVRILDDDTTEDGHAYLVMELLEGELLETRRIRKGGTLPLSDVYEVGEQLLDVLSAAHDNGIVHRDIKPDNLFVTQDGRLKVLDFGFAQMRVGVRLDVTATGLLLGTPGFMSPEQAVGDRDKVDAQTDIWAAGATLFTLVSGEPVHAGPTAISMLVAAANVRPRSLSSVTSGVPQALVEVVDRAIAFEKTKRWPNARMMQSALRKAVNSPRTAALPRRSIPDGADDTESTDFANDPMFVENLDSSDLLDSASATWPTPRPLEGGTDANAFDTDAYQRVDEDAATAANAIPFGANLFADDIDDPHDDNRTLIMDSPASQRNAPWVDASSRAARETAETMAPSPPAPALVNADADDERLFRRRKQALVFMGLTLVTMVIVIVGGLLFLTFSD
jgi:serine/threonine-protein kinase